MVKDNYVTREKNNGLAVVDGQIIPQRGTVDASELVATQTEDKQARRNGGGKKNTGEQG